MSQRPKTGGPRLAEISVVRIDLGLDPRSLSPLTPAEREVARMVAEGRSNADIAERRGTSAKTVANQLRAIYVKLGIGSRFELLAVLAQE